MRRGERAAVDEVRSMDPKSGRSSLGALPLRSDRPTQSRLRIFQRCQQMGGHQRALPRLEGRRYSGKTVDSKGLTRIGSYYTQQQ